MKEHHKAFNERISKAVKEAFLKKKISPQKLLQILKRGPSAEDEKRIREKTIEIGRRLRVARESQNLSLEEVAKAADITVTELSLMEKDTYYASGAVLGDVMQALKVDPKVILGGM